MLRYSKVLVVVTLVVSLITSLYVPSMAEGSDIVTFADATLEKAVRDNIGKATGDILKSDVASIRAIMLETDRVSNLQGIENLTSLGSLKITDSQLSDLSPLSGLPIYWVDFSNCQISNISVMSGFADLQFAYLKNNKISDVSALMGLTKLAEVEFTGNPVSEAAVRALPSGSIKFVASASVPTEAPVATATPTPEPTATPEPTPVVTVAPTAIPTPEPTATPTPIATPEPTPVVTVAPTATPTPVATVTPVATITPEVTPVVTESPVVPTATPVVEQTTPAAISLVSLDTMVMSAVSDKTSISLSWNESKNKKLLGYNIYRNDGVEDIALTDFPVTTTSFIDEKVVPGVEYTYSVEAVYGKKDFSEKSKAVTAKLTSEKLISLTVDNTALKVNGEVGKIDEQGSSPIVVDGRTVLPIRSIVESLGGTITWKGDTRLVTIKFHGTVLELTIDSDTAMVDGKNKTLDVPAMIKNGRTYIPLRFVAENLGCSIKWDAATKGIVISY